MANNKVNIIAKGAPGREYIITDMMATRLTEAKFKQLQEMNPDLFRDYRFIPQEETDFSWWSRISKKLTARKIYSGVYFHCDFYGNVTEEF